MQLEKVDKGIFDCLGEWESYARGPSTVGSSGSLVSPFSVTVVAVEPSSASLSLLSSSDWEVSSGETRSAEGRERTQGAP